MAENAERTDQNSAPSVDPILAWFQRAGALAVTLVGWVAALLPNYPNLVKPLAYALAAIITAASAIWLYRGRARATAKPFPPTLLPEDSLLRGLLPFEDGDRLIGRQADLADMMTMIRSDGFQFGVIWGQSGCGKTSFIRAGLLPLLRDRKFGALYLNRPTTDPVNAIRSNIATLRSDKNLVIVDQFEEYFVSHPARAEVIKLRKDLSHLLCEMDKRTAVVLWIRSDFFAKLLNLAPDIPDPTSPRTTFELQNLQSDKAKEVLEQSVALGTSQFDRNLIDAVISDLEADDHVQPAQLQLIATRLRRDGAKSQARYEELGRKNGLLGSFIKEELQRLPKPVIGEITLRKLCAPDGETKSPIDVSLQALVDELKAKGLTAQGDQELLLMCLSQFESSKIIVQTETEHYNLIHDTFAPLIRQATAGRESDAERASRLLLRYLADFQQDKNIRIPFQHLRLIKRYARRSLLSDDQSRYLLARSYAIAILTFGAPALVIVVPLVLAYALAWYTWYISTQPAIYKYGPPEIVVRHGHPNLRFLPGTDRLWMKPDLNLADLDPANPVATDEVPKGAIWGLARDDEAISAVLARISPMRRAELQRLLGEIDSAVNTVHDETKSSASPSFLKGAAERIGLVARANPSKMSERALSLLYDDARPQLPFPQSMRLMATLALLHIAEDKPEVGEKINVSMRDTLDVLSRMLKRDAFENPNWETPLVEETLSFLAIRKGRPPSQDDIEAFFSLLRDEKNDGAVRVIPLLASLLKSPVNAENVQPILIGWRGRLPEPAASAIPISFLYRSQPSAIPDKVFDKLRSYVEDTSNPERARAIAAVGLLRAGISNDRWRSSTAEELLMGAFDHNSELIGLKRAAVSVASEMAVAGQIKPEKAARALITIGRILVDKDEAGEDNWEFGNLDLAMDRFGRSQKAPVSQDVLEPVVQAVLKPAYSGGEMEAIAVLLAAARYAPEATLGYKDKLYDLQVRRFGGQDETPQFHRDILGVLARAKFEVGRKAYGARQREVCLQEMRTSEDSEQRLFGSYCLFLLAIDQPTQTSAIVDAVRPFLSSKDPTVRAAAAATLEMTTSASWVARAREDSSQRNRVRVLLRTQTRHPEAHIAFAGRIGLIVLDEL